MSNDNSFLYNAGTYYMPTTITTATTSGSLYPVMVGYPPASQPKDELAWLRRRVNEITGLVAA